MGRGGTVGKGGGMRGGVGGWGGGLGIVEVESGECVETDWVAAGSVGLDGSLTQSRGALQ